MKKLSEVSKITGASRRALQEYDRLKLVSPSGKTDAGYWLYDDAAIQRILFIQMFAEVGYERKKIKQILDSPDFDIAKELNNAVEALEEKRKKLGGMINMAKTWQVAAKLPTSTLVAMGHADITQIYQNSSFSNELKKSIDEASKYTEEELKEAEKYSPFFYHLLAIGCMHKHDVRVKLVQNCVHEFYRFFINMIEEDEDEKLSEEDIYDEEFIDGFIEVMRDQILIDSELAELIEKQCGENSVEYIIKALEVFKKLAVKGYWNNKKE